MKYTAAPDWVKNVYRKNKKIGPLRYTYKNNPKNIYFHIKWLYIILRIWTLNIIIKNLKNLKLVSTKKCYHLKYICLGSRIHINTFIHIKQFVKVWALLRNCFHRAHYYTLVQPLWRYRNSWEFVWW